MELEVLETSALSDISRVSATMHACRELDVIAEGVETIEHGTALLKLGCELAQSYGIARPIPASDVPGWHVILEHHWYIDGAGF